MKNLKNFMLIAIIAFLIIPMQSAAQKNRPNVKMEIQYNKPQRKPVQLRAMRENDFSLVYKIVKNTSFDKNKIDIIRVACIGSNFSSRQCARLLSLLSFEDNKIKALEIIAPKLIDLDNYNKILREFSFSSNRNKAEKILMRR